MLRVVIQIIDENGVILANHEADAMHPTQYKRNPDQPIEDVKYKLFGFTYQPHVMLKGKAGGF